MMPSARLLQMRRGWTPPRGLERSGPRDVSLTASGWALAVLSAVLVVGALIVGIGLYLVAERQQDQRFRVSEHGVDTVGVVTRLWIPKGKERRHWVAFQFDTGSGRVDGRMQVPRRIWIALRKGSSIPVRYDRDNPAVYVALGGERSALGFWVAYAAALGLAACGWLALLPMRRQRRLLADGRPAVGLVTKRRTVHHSHGRAYHQIEYEFLLLNGAAHTGSTVANTPQVGEPICVMYDPDNPAHSGLYPLSLVRPAVL